MTRNPVPLVKSCDAVLEPYAKRRVLRPFVLEDPQAFVDKSRSRAERIVAKIVAMSGAELDAEFSRVLDPLRLRHRDPEAALRARAQAIAQLIPALATHTEKHELLIGAYFSQEFSFESAALFNPSIVVHPDDAGRNDGDTRFVLSLRGIGEGHVSSLTFRTGVWRRDNSVTIDDASQFAVGPTVRQETLDNGRILVHLECGGAHDISETVLYPFLPSQGRGIEDARLVEFTDGDGQRSYRGTYTAFDGVEVRQGLLHTLDFRSFEMRGVEGALYAGKGMALFPRMINGRYAMLSRQDNESIWIVFSDDLYHWTGGTKLLSPRQPWEFVQLGNCGSPIEIDEGFLVLTHGVGATRNYCMGAALLDKLDPTQVISRSIEPLLTPADQRDGYVPNVVYSCGALVRGRTMLLPFGVADSITRFGTVSIDDLLRRMN